MGATKIVVTESIIHPGLKVCRGKDWRWNDQDKGSGWGIVVGEERSDGWWRVDWDEGTPFYNYRVGAGGAYDLYVWEEDGMSKQGVMKEEDKPKTSNKFREGDVIRAISHGDFMLSEGIKVGEVYTVYQLHGGADYIRIRKDGLWIAAKHFQKEEEEAKIKPGDTVECISTEDYWVKQVRCKVGGLYTVYGANNATIQIRAGDYWMPVTSFKKVGSYTSPEAIESLKSNTNEHRTESVIEVCRAVSTIEGPKRRGSKVISGAGSGARGRIITSGY